MIKFALEYLNKWGFSVIPLLPNKKPLIKWEEYQQRKPTEKEIRGWWVKYPGSMIGIVTGKISNLAVVDFDTKYMNKDLWGGMETPWVSTPRGYHYYFKYQDGITNTVNVGGKKLDIRGEGGYVVAPPSVNENGDRYEWLRGLIIGLPKFPIEILSEPKPISALPAPQEGTFIEGRRDHDLFHVAWNLVKGGMAEDEIRKVISQLAKSLPSSPGYPPITEKEAQEKVDSAVKRAVRKERPLALEVEEFVMSTDGSFSSTFLQKCLQLSTREEQKYVSVLLGRLRERGIIEKHGAKHGVYRRVERDCELIDWQNAPTEEIPLKFPLGIEEYVKIYPKSVIIIAGKSDAGKTSFLLEFARLNMDRHKIHLFINEAGDSEVAVRLGLVKNVKREDWIKKCVFREREDNFADVIEPNEINIIDYLDVTEDFANIGTPLKSIHNKLKKGIALIAIQKNPKQYDFRTGQYIDVDLGVGGAKSIGKSRLYLAIDDGILKIVKAKNRREKESPNGMTRTFKIYDGHEFSDVGLWKKP